MYIQTHASTPGTTARQRTCKEPLQTKEGLHFSFVRRNNHISHLQCKDFIVPTSCSTNTPPAVQQSRSTRARGNSRPGMIKVTVHEKLRVNEEQPTPASSTSRKSKDCQQHPSLCHRFLACTSQGMQIEWIGNPKWIADTPILTDGLMSLMPLSKPTASNEADWREARMWLREMAGMGRRS